jgi:FkbM family methyltransferase
MKDIIKIVNFDYERAIVFFNYLGNIEKNVNLRILSNNLTIHYDRLTLGVGDNVNYFIGFDVSVVERINNFDLQIWCDEFEFECNIKVNQNVKTFDLPNLITEIEDPSYYSFDEVFLREIYKDKLLVINEGDVVVDIGGNYGFFSLYAEQFNPSKIITFEPSKKTFNYLTNNFTSGDLHQKAVSGVGGISKFSENNSSSASSRLSIDGEYDVEVIGINDLFGYLGIDKIDYLKIDCEGAEKHIFEEISKETISKINKMVIEFHSNEIKDIVLNKLNYFGFKIERITTELIFTYNPEYYKKKKKIALVSTYCDTQEKKDVFLDLVKKVKSLGIDVIAISPLPLDKEHIEACDYLYFTKENPILGWPTRLFTFWREYVVGDGKVLTLQRGVGDYSWAALYHVKKLTQIAMDYDYDIFYHMIYDLEVDNNVENALVNFEGNIVYPRRDPHNPETLWETTLHFMSFDRDLMKKIEKEITLENYLSTNGVAEGEVFKWKNKFNIHGSENPVKDKIYYWKDFDFFDYSPSRDFKMFISKNDTMDIWLGENENVYKEILLNKLRLVFYNNNNLNNITLIVDNKRFNLDPKPFDIIELPINSMEVKEIKIVYRGEEFDLSHEYEKIMLNQIYINFKNS